jgi:hypothetical protein
MGQVLQGIGRIGVLHNATSDRRFTMILLARPKKFEERMSACLHATGALIKVNRARHELLCLAWSGIRHDGGVVFHHLTGRNKRPASRIG